MSLALTNKQTGTVVGSQPTITYGGNPGDLCIIHIESRRQITLQDAYGLSLTFLSGQSNGTLNSNVFARILTGAESTLQLGSQADDPINDRFFAVPSAYQIYYFSGATSSPYDGSNYGVLPSQHYFQYYDAITTAPNSLVLLLGATNAVVTSALAADTVAGYTSLGYAYDMVSGVAAFSKTQAAAGHTGAPNGTQSVSTAGVITHTICLFAAASSGGGGGGGGGGGVQARSFAVIAA